MKDKHTINLILISSRWLNSFYGDYSWWINSWLQVIHLSFRSWSSYHILGSRGFIFLLWSSKFSRLYRRKAPSKSLQGSPCIFNFSFFLSFFYYRSSSWRLNMVVHQGFFSFFNCSSRFLSKLWPAKLYSKINMVPNTCFVLRSSSILHLASEVQFFLPYLLRWCYVILDNFPSCFMIHKFSRLTYLNPSFSVRSRDLFNQSIFCWSYIGLYLTYSLP